jgi:hypothetical protein
VFSWYAIGYWSSLPIAFRILLIWAIAGTAMAWLYWLTVHEVIEFGAASFRIRKYMPRREKTKGYPIKQCGELEQHRGANNDCGGLQCKVDWETVTFRSEKQALENLAELQCKLPEVAREFGMNLNPDHGNFTTLALESRTTD